jgi:peptidyl-prolyl cis-trans isomerase SurA
MKAALAAAAWLMAGIMPSFALMQTASAPTPAPASASSAQPVVLDRVEAIIDGDVLLQSDVEEEMRFAVLEALQVLPGQNTQLRAVRRLITRTLILQQMKAQQQPVTASDAQVTQGLSDLRKLLPACGPYHCVTDDGWHTFLQANRLTVQEVSERWSQRLAILHFIDLRFRTGIRISKEQIDDYYQKTLLPALAKAGQKPPPLDAIAPKIQEVLLQQEVSGLLQDWLKSLRDEGSVQIVDPAYAALADAGSGDESE